MPGMTILLIITILSAIPAGIACMLLHDEWADEATRAMWERGEGK